MARYVAYVFKGQAKRIPFTFDKFSDAFEAAAAAEGIDLSRFRQMEQQIAALHGQQKALKDFRINESKRLGFSDIKLLRDDTPDVE
jgi:hypothetical protein